MDYTRLSGGAIQDNHALTLHCAGGAEPGLLELVVRSDAKSQVDVSLSREHEFQVMRVAFQAGVTVPEPLWMCRDVSVIGAAFFIMRRASGLASGRDVVRTERTAQQARGLVYRFGQELARLHQVTAPDPRLSFLPIPEFAPALSRVNMYRDALDALPEAHPSLELALLWLQMHAPTTSSVVLCHGDFRTGNYMVQDHQLSAVLDWEFAAWSDPYEDLGWLCAKSWRFGTHDKPVGGVGQKQDLLQGYASVSGSLPDVEALLYWEVMAMLRWAIIALQQAQRHLSGQEVSLELALTGRLLPEIEFDLLSQIHELEACNE